MEDAVCRWKLDEAAAQAAAPAGADPAAALQAQRIEAAVRYVTNCRLFTLCVCAMLQPSLMQVSIW